MSPLRKDVLLGEPTLRKRTAAGNVDLHLVPAGGETVAWLVLPGGRLVAAHGEFGVGRLPHAGDWVVGGVFRSPLPKRVTGVRVSQGPHRWRALSGFKAWLAVLPPNAGDDFLRVSFIESDGREHDGIDCFLPDLMGHSKPTSFGQLH